MNSESETANTFVGRQQEMATLDAALNDALSGRGQLVMLAGEPGIGKTRIAQELASRAESMDALVLWGWCYEREGAPPYWPWVQPMQSYVLETAPSRLQAEMGPGATDIADLIPEVREKIPGLKPPPVLEPQQTRFRLFNSIATFLKNLSRSKSLVLVLDDLHWADSPTLQLLEFLAREMTESRILVIGTYRDIEVSRQHPLSDSLAHLSRNPAFQRLKLDGLGTEDVGRFISAAGDENPTQELIDAIHAHTEGNPLFMSEVIRLLRDQEDPATPMGSGRPVALGLPQGVIEVIGQRLNRLSEECLGVLTTAAVIGRQFEFNLLNMLSRETTEAQLLGLVEEALDAHILGEIPDQRDRYQFSHALVQQTLLERISTSRRVRVHAMIGETLETLYGSQPGGHATELAYHFTESLPVTGPEKLVAYSLLAGERALETYAYEEALWYFKSGLSAKGVDLEGSLPARDDDSAALLFGLGRSQVALVDERAYSTLKRALDHYANSGNLEQVVAIAEVPDYGATTAGRVGPEQLFDRALPIVPAGSLQSGRLLSRYGQFIGLQDAAYDKALDALDQALTIAQREGDKALELQSLAALTSVHSNHMRFDEALESGLKAIELAKSVNDLRSEVSAYYFVVTRLIEKGELNSAHLHASEMLSKAELLRDRFWLEGAFWKYEICLRIAGEWQMARSLGRRALDIGSTARPFLVLSDLVLLEHETGDLNQGNLQMESLLKAVSDSTGPRYNSGASACFSLTVPLVARITGVVDQLESAKTAAARVLGNPQATPILTGRSDAGLAMTAVLSADTDSAAKQYDVMKEWRHTFLFFSISADRLLGLLAQTMGNLDQALVHFSDALTFCRNGGFRPELAWTCHDYADMLLERKGDGDASKAALMVEEALGISTELGMKPLLVRLAALQETSERQPVPPPAYPDGLSSREVEVLRLIAAGRTDREIAEELFISVRTVGHHVGNILNKTGSANRAEAASYANQQGLVTPNFGGGH